MLSSVQKWSGLKCSVIPSKIKLLFREILAIFLAVSEVQGRPSNLWLKIKNNKYLPPNFEKIMLKAPSLDLINPDIGHLMKDLRNLEKYPMNENDWKCLGNALFQLTKITTAYKTTPNYKHIEKAILEVWQLPKKTSLFI